MLRRFIVAACLGVAVLGPTLLAAPAAAEEPRRLLVVEVDPGQSGVAPDAVRQAIASELDVDVADAQVEGSVGTLVVTIRDGGRATVVFRAPDGRRSIERSVDLPADPSVRVEAIALLAGNLARDEAQELADALEAARAARRLELERATREAAAQRAAADAAAAAAAGAAARQRGAATPAASAGPGAAAAPGGAEPGAGAAPSGAEPGAASEPAGAKEPGEATAQPTLQELHERVTARVDTQSAALAAYDDRRLEPFQLALTSPVALYPYSGKLRFHGILSLLYVDAGGLEGVAVAAGLQRIQGNVRGAQAAGVWNEVKGLHYGAQVAGIGNHAGGPLRGAEAAGILNLRDGAVQGFQSAGIFNQADAVEGIQQAGIYNHARHDLLGAQVAGLANYVGGDAMGVQAAGLVSIAGGSVEGAQVSGLVNVAREPVTGVQVAGLVNADRAAAPGALDADGTTAAVRIAGLANHGAVGIAGAEVAGLYNVAADLTGAQLAGLFNGARDVDGAQIGLVNVGRDVVGTQIGLVNVSRELDGFPVGLVNVSRTGRQQLVLWHERKAELAPDTVGAGLNLGAKFVAGYGYTLFGLGGDARDSTWAFNAALGARIPVERVFFELDAMYRGEWDARASNENDAQAIHYRAKVGVEIVPRAFGVFVGGGLRQEIDASASTVVVSYSPLALAGVEVL